MPNRPSEEASRHILDKAERLFLEKGYAQTKLRDLADSLAMKPASLYYHAPGGKEELWDRVIDRALKRHHDQLVQAAQQASGDLRGQLRAMGYWLISQPPVNLISVVTSDSTQNTGLMADRIYEGLMRPVSKVIRQAKDRGEVRDIEPDLISGVFVTSVNGMLPLARDNQLPASLQELVNQLVDVLIDGIKRK